MIVVEGPDGSGKSTLVKWICKQFNLKEGQRSEKDRDKIYLTTRADTWRALHDECLATAPPRVWDRMGPYSDPIYSLRGIPSVRPCAFTPSEVKMFHNFMTNTHFGLLILCLPPLQVVQANAAKEHQLEGVVDRTADIWHDYKLMHRGGTLVYDYTRRGHQTGVALAISTHLKHRKAREFIVSHP